MSGPSKNPSSVPATVLDAASKAPAATLDAAARVPSAVRDAASNTDPRTMSHLHPQGSFDLGDHPLPTGKEEIWRFTPLDRLSSVLQGAVGGSPDQGSHKWASDGVKVAFDAPGGGGSDPGSPDWAPDGVEVEFDAPGGGSPDPGPPDWAPDGVKVVFDAPGDLVAGPLAIGQAPRGTVLVPTDRVAALASLGAPRAHFLRVPAGRVLDRPIRVDVTGQSDAAPAAYHLVIEAGPGSAATVLLHHVGTAHCLGNVEVVVGDGARLTVVTSQDWDATAVHLGQHEARVGRDAQYRHIAVTLGGDLVRLQNNVSYAGSGGTAELFGVYFADAGQHIEHRLFVDHNHPKGKSLADYRGALQGEGARSVWIGDVLIRPEARGIETYESNKNLVLSDGCRADAVPNLEIETGEILGAGHSASTGRFDEEQLFYLRSRGIDEAEARRLVVRGFFAQLVGRIGVADVEEALMAKIDRELGAAQAGASGAPGDRTPGGTRFERNN